MISRYAATLTGRLVCRQLYREINICLETDKHTGRKTKRRKRRTKLLKISNFGSTKPWILELQTFARMITLDFDRLKFSAIFNLFLFLTQKKHVKKKFKVCIKLRCIKIIEFESFANFSTSNYTAILNFVVAPKCRTMKSFVFACIL